MKKIYILLLTIFCSTFSYAQLIHEFEQFHTYKAKIFGLGFESPTPILENANGWYGSDSLIVAFGRIVKFTGTYNKQVFKVAGHSGANAIEVRTTFQDSLPIPGIGNGPTPGVASNLPIFPDTTIQINGTPLTIVSPVSIAFWYKTNILGNDSTFVNATLIDDSDGADSIVADAFVTFGATVGAWTRVEIPFTYTSTLLPTKVQIQIASGNPFVDSTNPNVPDIGTSIAVDDISIIGPLGAQQVVYASGFAKVYPNPASSFITVKTLEAGQYSMQMYDALGNLVLSNLLQNTSTNININKLPIGTYAYKILDAKGSIIQTNKFVKQ